MSAKTVLPARPGAPFSKAVKANGFWFVTGHVAAKEGLDPTDIAQQTRGTLENLKRTLGECGVGMENVVRATVYLVNMSDFAAMNAVYKEYFPVDAPARTCFGVKELATPDYLVEIDVVALADA